MGIWTSKRTEPDHEVRKGIEDIKKEMEQQKRNQLKYLIISIIAFGVFGFVLGKLF